MGFIESHIVMKLSMIKSNLRWLNPIQMLTLESHATGPLILLHHYREALARLMRPFDLASTAGDG